MAAALFLSSLLLLLPAVHASIHFTVLSPGTPQASLEVLFDGGGGGGKEEVLHTDLRSLVSRSGTIQLATNGEGWRPGQQPFPSSSSSLARLSTQRKGHALLAPEQPGDVVVLDLTSSLPTSTSSALVVVRGATVLAREGGVQVGQVNDKELIKALLSVSKDSTAAGGGGGGGGGGGQPPPLQRYSGTGTLSTHSFTNPPSHLPIPTQQASTQITHPPTFSTYTQASSPSQRTAQSFALPYPQGKKGW